MPSTTALTSSSFATSARMNFAVPPPFWMACTTATPCSSRRAATTTFAPSRANASAVARPMPALPPRTRTTFESNRFMARCCSFDTGPGQEAPNPSEPLDANSGTIVPQNRRDGTRPPEIEGLHSAGMARTREFDVDEALDRATALFWTRGYEATSVQDLVDALGVNRASLYGTFGDKAQLFAPVLERYGRQVDGVITDALAPPPPARRRSVRGSGP